MSGIGIGVVAQQGGPDSANRIAAQGFGEDTSVDLSHWGTLEQMIEPVWVTQGLPVQRTTITTWSVPGKVLILRHGPTDRMKLGVKYADIVQRIERNPSTGKFTISYSYEDGRKLEAVGQVEADGTFAETLTAADGTPQRNLYLLDNPRKMRIARQKRSGTGWANASFATKVGETPTERLAREAGERRQREAIAAAEQARKDAEAAEQEARWAQEDADRAAEDAEEDAQRQRSWQIFQNDMQGIVDKQRQDIEDSRRFRQRIEADVARVQEAKRREEEARRAATTPAPRSPAPAITVAPQRRAPESSSPRPVTTPPQGISRPPSANTPPVSTPPPAAKKMCTRPPRPNSTGLMGTNSLAENKAQLQTMLKTWCGGKPAQVTKLTCKVSAGTAEKGISVCDADYICPAITYSCPAARQE